ncbi:MAG TPA: monovalent cation:proton antiporter-2 (CPA2) family protein, partial [Afifellaceae bacterium]|nr:monovalent cation:proton antiporter-2 (CPA2) family protein [Afifellaceae bacterium]
MAEAESVTADVLLFGEPLILLGAAVLAVPIFKRLGLGSVLGYLAAGVVIGPIARLITGPEEIFHVAELGVVFFLFIVGLELKPARLWQMRSDIFGLGAAQVIGTGIALTALFSLVGWRLEPAIIIGFGLAMSSTAVGMQILAEKNEMNLPYGRKAFSILLFQDIAIIPLLAVVPLLAPASDGFATSGFGEFIKVVAAIGVLYLAGRYLLNPMFRLLALTQAREIMTAAALLVVLGAAALMDLVGLSMAMGAFMAGVMLADSSFRHELEANIEPFRGILLGLFFMAVGMSINIDSVLYSWWRIVLAVPIVMSIKAGILYGLNRLFGASHNDSVRVALLLPQAGEFAFVLFASAGAVRALWPSETSFVAAIVTVSMALTPLAVSLVGRLIEDDEEETMEENFEGAGGDVLLIGFGRFGQIVSQILLARDVSATIIDASAERIRQAARFGFRIYFGDGGRLDVLRAAGAQQAKIICICVDKADSANRITELVLSEFPNAKIYVRSWDRGHTIDLIEKGVDFEMR